MQSHVPLPCKLSITLTKNTACIKQGGNCFFLASFICSRLGVNALIAGIYSKSGAIKCSKEITNTAPPNECQNIPFLSCPDYCQILMIIAGQLVCKQLFFVKLSHHSLVNYHRLHYFVSSLNQIETLSLLSKKVI